MTRELSIMVVEQNDLLREKTAGILSRAENVQMVVMASNEAIVLSIAAKNILDFILVDFHFATKHDGFVDKLHQACPSAQIMLLSDTMDVRYNLAASQLGAHGLTQKSRLANTLPLSFENSTAAANYA